MNTKQQMSKQRMWLLLALNLLMVVLETVGMVMSFTKDGFAMLQFYTEDSNILNLIACLICGAAMIRVLSGKASDLPQWVRDFSYVAVCCLMVTFLVVLTILAPMAQGAYGVMLFKGSMLYNHFLCPVLALVTFLFGSQFTLSGKSIILKALIPTAIYASIAVILNILEIMVGPYPFLRVREQPVGMSVLWFCVVFGIDLIISALLWWLRKRRLEFLKNFVAGGTK